MLDMKRTFDEIVIAHPTPNAPRRFWRTLLPSPLEFIRRHPGIHGDGETRPIAPAVGRRGSWDLIVVDTPPSRSALDFLDAPKRLGSFLDGRLIRVPPPQHAARDACRRGSSAPRWACSPAR